MLWLTLLALLVGEIATYSNLCYSDENLPHVQEHTFTLQDAPTSDYWNKYDPRDPGGYPTYNLHLSYYLFGEITKDTAVVDTTLTAKYLTADDELIYSVEISLSEGCWTSYYTETSAVDSTKSRQVHEEGKLEDTQFAEGALIDLILKVEQDHLLNWLLNGEPLQSGSELLTSVGGTRYRHRALKVNSIPAAEGHKMVYKTEGGAVMTRLAVGRCIVWPRQITADCGAVYTWLTSRSKLKSATTPGVHGNHLQSWSVSCYSTSPYYQVLQELVKPNEALSGTMERYCCCVAHDTGEVSECQVIGGSAGDCTLGCATLWQAAQLDYANWG